MFIQKLLKGIYITKKYVLCKVQGILYYNLKNLQGGTIMIKSLSDRVELTNVTD